MPNWIKSLWSTISGRIRTVVANEPIHSARPEQGSAHREAAALAALRDRPSDNVSFDLPPLPAPHLPLDLLEAMGATHARPAHDFRLAARLASARVLNRPSSRGRKVEPVAKKAPAPRRLVWLASKRTAGRSAGEVVALPVRTRGPRPIAEAA